MRHNTQAQMSRFSLKSADVAPVSLTPVVVNAKRCSFPSCSALRGNAHVAGCPNARLQQVEDAEKVSGDFHATNAAAASKSSKSTSKETTTMATKTARKSTKKAPAKRTIAKTAKPKTGVCQCGCKGATKGGNFLPGHDARLVGIIKRGEIKTLSPFQQDFAKSHGIKLGESAKGK